MASLPPREFTGAVRDWCAAHGLIPRDAAPGAAGRRTRIVVGVSGGPDSLALLQALHELSGPLGLSLHVAHLDHGLRRGSAADAAFTAARARALGWPCTTGRTAVAPHARRRRISLEEAGRLARYSFFHRVATRGGYRLVAVGHTRDDQAETVLMRLMRGASMSGLAGIAPRRGLIDPLARAATRGSAVEVIRPLLARSRGEVEAFLRLRRLTPRRDPSNTCPDFLRNRIRRELIPYLERRYNPAVRAALARAGEVLAEEDGLLEAGALAALKRVTRGRGVPGLDLRGLARLPVATRRRVLRLAAVGAGTDLNRLTQPHLDALVRLTGAGAGETHLPGLRATAGGRVLRLRRVH